MRVSKHKGLSKSTLGSETKTQINRDNAGFLGEIWPVKNRQTILSMQWFLRLIHIPQRLQ